MTKIASSQDFRNLYEEFYNRIRAYLWPISTLKILADVECNIYSAFIDYPKLRLNLDKLHSVIKDTMKEDEYLKTAYDDLSGLVDEVDPEETKSYLKLYQVSETDPELVKTIKSQSEEDEDNENNEETAGQSI